MSHLLRSALLPLCLAAAALPAAAAGSVQVRYVEPEHFADIGRSSVDRERVLKSISEYVQSLGAQLPDGQVLQVDVTDIDLAGEIRPWGVQEVRVLRGRADWPHLNLRYALQAEGRTLKTGEARLADPNYMYSLRSFEVGTELAHEKRLLRVWFDENFTPKH